MKLYRPSADTSATTDPFATPGASPHAAARMSTHSGVEFFGHHRHLGLRQAGDPQLAEFLLRQAADRYRPREFAYTSRTALLTKRRAVRSTNQLVTKRA